MPFDWKDLITPIVTVTEVLGDIIMYVGRSLKVNGVFCWDTYMKTK